MKRVIFRIFKSTNYVFLLLIFFGGIIGWNLKAGIVRSQINSSIKDNSLRLDGYSFTRPLLACSTNNFLTNIGMDDLENKLDELSSGIDSDNNAQVSIFYRDLNTGKTININPSFKFNPASLNKIPIMMTALKQAENNSDFLEKKVVLEDTTDTNITQEITPEDYIRPGIQYTILEAIKKMIIYSDNNAFNLLTNYLDSDIYKSVFYDMKVPINYQDTNVKDYLTVEDFSYFLRVLYNATYLNREYSEKALNILAQSTYNKGIVAGVSGDVQIAHKYGLYTQFVNNSLNYRELHDCGIVYHPTSPYLLCVMTKSNTSLSIIESKIQEISKTVSDFINSQN